MQKPWDPGRSLTHSSPAHRCTAERVLWHTIMVPGGEPRQSAKICQQRCRWIRVRRVLIAPPAPCRNMSVHVRQSHATRSPYIVQLNLGELIKGRASFALVTQKKELQITPTRAKVSSKNGAHSKTAGVLRDLQAAASRKPRHKKSSRIRARCPGRT